MNEMRRDPITRKWIILDREINVQEVVKELKHAVSRDMERVSPPPCDFCPGHEETTRPAILEFTGGQMYYKGNSSDWQIRVIPNRNPVFRIEGNVNRRLVSIYDVMDAVGAHEVIIENRDHIDWDEISIQDVANILKMYHERMNDLSKDERFGHLFIFKNFGPNSNTRIAHPHSQLIASPSVPERIRRELDFTRAHFRIKERCVFCDIISEELRHKNHHSGLVKTYSNFVTISPFFASHPFETWILPRRHTSDFRNLSSDIFLELATAVRENLSFVKRLVGPLSYTLLLFTRPNKIWGGDRDYWSTIDSDYHWHFKFFPRFPRRRGFHRSFSAGSGYMVNQIPPETAAELLRSQME